MSNESVDKPPLGGDVWLLDAGFSKMSDTQKRVLTSTGRTCALICQQEAGPFSCLLLGRGGIYMCKATSFLAAAAADAEVKASQNIYFPHLTSLGFLQISSLAAIFPGFSIYFEHGDNGAASRKCGMGAKPWLNHWMRSQSRYKMGSAQDSWFLAHHRGPPGRDAMGNGQKCAQQMRSCSNSLRELGKTADSAGWNLTKHAGRDGATDFDPETPAQLSLQVYLKSDLYNFSCRAAWPSIGLCLFQKHFSACTRICSSELCTSNEPAHGTDHQHIHTTLNRQLHIPGSSYWVIDWHHLGRFTPARLVFYTPQEPREQIHGLCTCRQGQSAHGLGRRCRYSKARAACMYQCSATSHTYNMPQWPIAPNTVPACFDLCQICTNCMLWLSGSNGLEGGGAARGWPHLLKLKWVCCQSHWCTELAPLSALCISPARLHSTVLAPVAGCSPDTQVPSSTDGSALLPGHSRP